MNVSISHHDNVLTVRFDGAVDYTATGVMETLIGDLKSIKATKVVFDLTHVPRVDSVGLGFLHLANDEILAAGATMVLRGANVNVLRLFEITESNRSFEVE